MALIIFSKKHATFLLNLTPIIMEKKKVNISYACPIKWDDMQSLDDKSKFCGSCKMKVHDFTKDTELNTTGIHCGRFRMDQVESINRSFSFNPKQVFVVSLFSLLGMTAPLAAQSNSDSTLIDSSQVISKEFIKLKGVVRDKKTQEGIVFSNVVIKDGAGGIVQGGSTDLNGNFELDILHEFLEKEDFIIEVSVIGYSSVRKEYLKGQEVSASFDFYLTESDEHLGIVGGIYHQPFDPNGTTSFDSEDIHESPNRQ